MRRSGIRQPSCAVRGKIEEGGEEKMGQMVDFTMEREGLVKPCDRVSLKEDRASTMSGIMYYYTIRDAIAMSSNLKRPLGKLTGTVRKVDPQVSIYMVTVEIDD